MNKQTMGCWLAAMTIGAFGSSAQSLATYSWDDSLVAPPDPSLQASMTLKIVGPTLRLGATFGSTVSFTPAPGTPANTLETYTVTFSNVSLGIASTKNNSLGNGLNNDLVLKFGTISETFTVDTGNTPTALQTVTLASVTKNASYALNSTAALDSFTVRWLTVDSLVSVVGGKGVDTVFSVDTLHGRVAIPTGLIPPVPEPVETASVFGLGLLAVALWRNRR